MKTIPDFKPRRPVMLRSNLRENMLHYGSPPKGWRWRREGEVVDGNTDLWVACHGFTYAHSMHRQTYKENSHFFPIITPKIPETKESSAPKVSAEVQTLLAKAKMLEDTIATAQAELDKIKEAIRGLT